MKRRGFSIEPFGTLKRMFRKFLKLGPTFAFFSDCWNMLQWNSVTFYQKRNHLAISSSYEIQLKDFDGPINTVAKALLLSRIF